MNDTLFFFIQDNWFPSLLVLALALILLRLVLIGRRGRMWRDLGKDTAKAAVASSLAAGALGLSGIAVPPPAAATVEPASLPAKGDDPETDHAGVGPG